MVYFHMYFLFDRENPKELIFYVLVIILGLILDYYDIADVEKVIAVGILAVIVRFVIKTLLFGTCNRCDKKDD